MQFWGTALSPHVFGSHACFFSCFPTCLPSSGYLSSSRACLPVLPANAVESRLPQFTTFFLCIIETSFVSPMTLTCCFPFSWSIAFLFEVKRPPSLALRHAWCSLVLLAWLPYPQVTANRQLELDAAEAESALKALSEESRRDLNLLHEKRDRLRASNAELRATVEADRRRAEELEVLLCTSYPRASCCSAAWLPILFVLLFSSTVPHGVQEYSPAHAS